MTDKEKVVEFNCESTLEMAGLGRTFKIGSLYDCRYDKVISDQSLGNFDSQTVVYKEEPCPDFRIINEKNPNEKYNSFFMDENGMLSIACGFLELNGASKYLTVNTDSSNVACVALKYVYYTHRRQVDLKRCFASNQSKYSFENGTATHAVCGIQYGAESVFALSRDVAENEDKAQVEELLKMVIGRIVVSDIDYGCDAEIQEGFRRKLDGVRFSYYGDIKLENRSPSTFEEVVQTLKYTKNKIEELSVDNKHQIKISLYPLCKLNSKAQKMVRTIKVDYASEVQNLFAERHQVQRSLQSAKKHPLCNVFPGIEEQLSSFARLINGQDQIYRTSIQSTIAQIRGGNADEMSLEKVIVKLQDSAFSDQKLEEWLKFKNTELECLNKNCSELNGIPIISKKSDMNALANSCQGKQLILLDFGMARNNWNSFLEEFENYVDGKSAKLDTDNEYDFNYQWFIDEGNLEILRRSIDFLVCISGFTGNAELIKCACDARLGSRDLRVTPGVIFLYQNGKKTSFSFPSTPGIPRLLRRTEKMINLDWSKPEFRAAAMTGYTLQCQLEHDADGNSIVTMDTDINHISVTPKKDGAYIFRVAAKCEKCTCEFSSWSQPF